MSPARPLYRNFRFQDFEEYSALLPSADMRFVQAGPGPLDGQIKILQDLDSIIMHLRIGAPSIMTSASLADFVAIGIPMPQQKEYIINGLKIDQNDIFISSIDDCFTTQAWSRDTLALGFSRADFMRDLSSRLGGVDLEISQLPRRISCSEDSFCYIRSFAFDALHRPTATTEDLQAFELRKVHFREVLLDRIASAIDQSDNVKVGGRESIIVKRALDVIDTQAPDTLTISSLCGSVGVSYLTLYRAFASITGLPPSSYIKFARLNKARGLLLRDVPRQAAVKQAAIDAGFFDFGRFSVEYRRLFGEKPSDTIRR